MSKKQKKTLPEEAFYLGLGLTSVVKDQLETFMSALIKEGKLIAKDKAKFRKELAQKGQAEYKKMVSMIEKSVTAGLKKTAIPSRKEFEALKRKVEGGKKPAKAKTSQRRSASGRKAGKKSTKK